MLIEIENKVKEYSDKEYAFITGNGTSAIYLSLKASSIPKGSKIAVTNISCPDPVYALIWAGYTPIFIDINIEDYNMDLYSLEVALKQDSDIKAVIAIHLFGNSCDIVSISKLSKKYKCFLIEDCAQSFGNEIEEGMLGSFGDVSIFSFGNGKIIEAGHGGSVQTNSKELIDNIRDEYKKLNSYKYEKIEKLSKIHRYIYYKLYYVGQKYSRLNILNLIYIYFFKSYYLYRLDKKSLNSIKSEIDSFEDNKIARILKIDRYSKSLEKDVELPTFHNRENILSRLTVYIDDAEDISKKIRDNNIPSNTMYPMLIDRFKLFFNKSDYINSYKLKGKLLNLWLNSISKEDLSLTIKIIKDRNG